MHGASPKGPAMEGRSTNSQKGLSNYPEMEQEGIFPAIEMEQNGEGNRARLIQTGSTRPKILFQEARQETTTASVVCKAEKGV